MHWYPPASGTCMTSTLRDVQGVVALVDLGVGEFRRIASTLCGQVGQVNVTCPAIWFASGLGTDLLARVVSLDFPRRFMSQCSKVW